MDLDMQVDLFVRAVVEFEANDDFVNRIREVTLIGGCEGEENELDTKRYGLPAG